MEPKKNRCVICDKEYKGYGNNAHPVKNGTCCDRCNQELVIPKRIELYISMKKKK